MLGKTRCRLLVFSFVPVVLFLNAPFVNAGGCDFHAQMAGLSAGRGDLVERHAYASRAGSQNAESSRQPYVKKGLKLALFPGKEAARSSDGRSAEFFAIWRRAIMENVLEAARKAQGIDFAFTFYDSAYVQDSLKNPHQLQSIPHALGPDASKMWRRKSLLSGYGPDVPLAAGKGREIGADLIIMYKLYLVQGVSFTGGKADLTFYLIDVAGENCHEHFKGNVDSSSDILPPLEKLIKSWRNKQ